MPGSVPDSVWLSWSARPQIPSPPYQTVYSCFSRGAKSEFWEKALAHLIEKTRKDAGKNAEPHYALIDSQSVKTVADNEARGIDREKNKRAKTPYGRFVAPPSYAKCCSFSIPMASKTSCCYCGSHF